MTHTKLIYNHSGKIDLCGEIGNGWCESWIIIPQMLNFSSIVFLSINDLNPDKPPNNNY
jgi:hypothetical protein